MQSSEEPLNLTHANVTEDNSTYYFGEDDFERNLYLAITIVFSLIIIFGFIGNLLVILVVSMNKHMRSSTNILLLNLAVADLSFILVSVFFTLLKFTGRWIFGNAWCKIMNYVTYTCAWVSVYTLVLLCIDRVLAVVFAIQMRGVRSVRNGVIAIAIVWIVASLANIPALLFHGEVKYVDQDGIPQTSCIFLLTVDESSKQIFQLCFFVFGFALPVAVISVLYTILTVFITRKSNKMASTSSKTVSRAKKRITVTVIVVVIAFVVCWLPLQILMLLSNFGLHKNESRLTIIIQMAANCLAYMNSCINPALYTMTSTTFRSAFLNLLCCRKKNLSSQTTTATQMKDKKNVTVRNRHLSQTAEEMKTSMEELPLLTAKRLTIKPVPVSGTTPG